MHDEITVETDLFEHREVKPHFINPCCFGIELRTIQLQRRKNTCRDSTG